MALKKSEVAKFKKRLEEMRRQLTQSLKGTAAEVKTPDETTGYSQHQADQGTDDFDRTISLEVTTREFGLLKQIDRALEKIEEGAYGLCDVTEKRSLSPFRGCSLCNNDSPSTEQIERGFYKSVIAVYKQKMFSLFIASGFAVAVLMLDLATKYLINRYLPFMYSHSDAYPYGGIGYFKILWELNFPLLMRLIMEQLGGFSPLIKII